MAGPELVVEHRRHLWNLLRAQKRLTTRSCASTSADAAIEAIIEHGEGARGDWRTARYGRFLRIWEEYRQLREQDPLSTRRGRSPRRSPVSPSTSPSRSRC